VTATRAPIRVALGATALDVDDATAAAMRAEFRRSHALRLKGFLGPELLEVADRALGAAAFEHRSYERVGEEDRAADGVLLDALLLALNEGRLLDAVERVTGVGGVGWFNGRVYRFVSKPGHEFEWHDDLVEERLLALTVNVGARPYRGGLLKIREKDGRREVFEAANVTRGDAVLFRVHPTLEHCVTPVEGDVPRLTFAGWFHPGSRVRFGGPPVAT
jgi:hypothetical protein